MRMMSVAISLVLAATPAAAQDVDVGQISWSKLPALKEKTSRLDYADLALRVQTLLETGDCNIPRQSPRRFDITVPYAVLVEPSGRIARVVVSKMNCTGIEMLVGQAVLARADAGDYLPTGEAASRWYASALNFNLR